ncbi:MAG: hypothetical protein U0V74_12000 [Chitinophagales bacterium]
MSQSPPYLSVVVAARNDNYGGDFELRLQNCINWFSYYAVKYKLPAEFIVVNYNPVIDRPPLNESIKFPPSSNVLFRLITVPNHFHEGISNPAVRKKVPLYEYVAKNIGIRRAKGQYILSANPDILIDPAIIKFIAGKKLKADFYYRANRCDYKNDLKLVNPATDLPTVRSKVFRIFKKGFMWPLQMGTFWPFQLWSLERKNRKKLNYEFWLLENEKWANEKLIPVTYDNMSFKFHSNCSGDFMLMHRNAWFNLHGHPENTYLSMHTDAIAVAMAFYSGLKEHVFFEPVYHQDHERRFVADNNQPDIFAMFRKFEDDSRQMEKEGKPIIYNNEDWGFASEVFTETVF